MKETVDKLKIEIDEICTGKRDGRWGDLIVRKTEILLYSTRMFAHLVGGELTIDEFKEVDFHRTENGKQIQG